MVSLATKTEQISARRSAKHCLPKENVTKCLDSSKAAAESKNPSVSSQAEAGPCCPAAESSQHFSSSSRDQREISEFGTFQPCSTAPTASSEFNYLIFMFYVLFSKISTPCYCCSVLCHVCGRPHNYWKWINTRHRQRNTEILLVNLVSNSGPGSGI